MIKNCDRSASDAPPISQADPGSGSAFSLGHDDVSLEQQSARGIELFKVALKSGNLTAAASSLKHLSELHGLNKPKAEATPTASGLSELTDEELDRLIADLTS